MKMKLKAMLRYRMQNAKCKSAYTKSKTNRIYHIRISRIHLELYLCRRKCITCIYFFCRMDFNNFKSSIAACTFIHTRSDNTQCIQYTLVCQQSVCLKKVMLANWACAVRSIGQSASIVTHVSRCVCSMHS